MELLDWRDKQIDPPAAWQRAPGKSPRALIKAGRVVRRSMIDITGVVLHQTACVYGVTKAQISRAGGDRTLARNKRLQDIPAHLVVAQDGTAILNAPLAWHLYHGNGFNPFTLGIECEGRYDGRKVKSQVPAAQLEALCAGLKRMIELAREEGAVNLDHFYAHRQSNGKKPGDPGPELWLGVIDFATTELGLKPRYDYVCPKTPGTATPQGRPIPREWDPRATAPYL